MVHVLLISILTVAGHAALQKVLLRLPQPPLGLSRYPDYEVMTVVIFADEPTYEAWMASPAAGGNQ